MYHDESGIDVSHRKFTQCAATAVFRQEVRDTLIRLGLLKPFLDCLLIKFEEDPFATDLDRRQPIHVSLDGERLDCRIATIGLWNQPGETRQHARFAQLPYQSDLSDVRSQPAIFRAVFAFDEQLVGGIAGASTEDCIFLATKILFGGRNEQLAGTVYS